MAIQDAEPNTRLPHLVCLERGGDSQPCSRVSIQYVHEFLFFYCSNHDGSTFGVNRLMGITLVSPKERDISGSHASTNQILSRNDPATARFSKRFAVHLLQRILFLIVLENHNPVPQWVVSSLRWLTNLLKNKHTNLPESLPTTM